MVNESPLIGAREVAELRRDRASARLRRAQEELDAAEAEYGAASRDVQSFDSPMDGEKR